MINRQLSRRDAIGEAIIAILATEGPRGLTHRKIDETLGYPLGSTSGYFRRRLDLFRAGFEKLIELNMEDMIACQRELIPLYDEGGSLDLRLVAKYHARAWKLLTEEHPHRLVANLEYLLEGARDPQLRRMIEHNMNREEAFTVGIFDRLGAKNPALAAAVYVSFMHAETRGYLLVPPYFNQPEKSEDFFFNKLKDIIEETDKLPKDVAMRRQPVALPLILTWNQRHRSRSKKPSEVA